MAIIVPTYAVIDYPSIVHRDIYRREVHLEEIPETHRERSYELDENRGIPGPPSSR
jgi:hypothetical protein